MSEQDIQEMMFIVKSIEKSRVSVNDNFHLSEAAVKRCEDFCKKHNINITHGSAFKELRHKYYYYRDNCIDDIMYNRKDKYHLRQSGALTDKEIVDRILYIK